MASTIVRGPNGEMLAFGSPGGSIIITTVVGIAVNLIDFGLPLPEAIAAPRLSQCNTGSTQVDGDFEQTAIGQGLTAPGQVLDPVPEWAAVGLVVWPDGVSIAAAEPTRRLVGSDRVVKR